MNCCLILEKWQLYIQPLEMCIRDSYKSESHKLHQAFPVKKDEVILQGQPVQLNNDGTIQAYFGTGIYLGIEMCIRDRYKDGDKIYICFRDNEKFLEKSNQNFYKDLKRKILISIRSKLIRDKKFKLKRLVNFEKQNITVIIYETL